MLLFSCTRNRCWEWDRGTEIKKRRERLAGLPYQSPFTASIQWPNSCRLVHDIFAAEVVHEIKTGTSSVNHNVRHFDRSTDAVPDISRRKTVTKQTPSATLWFSMPPSDCSQSWQNASLHSLLWKSFGSDDVRWRLNRRREKKRWSVNKGCASSVASMKAICVSPHACELR